MSDSKDMTLTEHIQELRQRLLRALIVWLVVTIGATFFVDYVLGWLVKPLGENEVIVLSPTEAPIIYFKVALMMGFMFALPYILYQVYTFVAPGLLAGERAIFLAGVPAALMLAVLGALFTLEVLIPLSLPILMRFLGGVVQPTYSLEQYLSFVTTLVVWMGLLFQTPLVIYMIARLGFIEPAQLTKLRKVIIFLAAVAAAVITPTTDPVTMLLVTGPFVVLYEVGIMLARVAIRQRKRAAARAI